MARSPYQGTFQPNYRPTVVTAPDAMVFINGEVDIIGCPSCKKRFDFGKYITQIQVDLSLDSVPGNASITMSIPRHVVDDFYFDGVPLVTPMMEVEIFAKGYYLLEGLPQFYPIFWGMITEVSDSYSGGEHTVTLHCADILKWWEICRMNINPAFTAPTGQAGRSIFGNVFFGTNPYDAIFTLANMAFGDVIVGTGSLISLYKESGQKSTFNTVLGDIMQYWASRFTRIRSNLLLYGVNGVAVRGDSIAQAYERGKSSKGVPFASSAVRAANGGNAATQMIFDPTDKGVTAFRTQFSQAGVINFWQSEYQTKLEIANACKEAVGFEFYMDVTGDIVFKPPFYNLDILSNKPVSWVQDIDIIDWDFSENEAEVVTQMTIQGSFGGNIDFGFGEEMVPSSSVTDYHLLRKYGWRPHSYNSEFMGDPLMMFYHGLDIMDRLNSRRHTGTVNIPLRPELRLGFPIYIAPKDQVWYIRGISHNIQFGGRATTTLNLTARREKFKAPKGISNLKMTGDFADEAFKKAKAQYDKLVADKKAKGSPPKPPPPKKDGGPPGPPTIKQLAQKAFNLELGDAATIPPVNVDPNNPKSLEPYEPLILRHPKTGKIVGYPNVVMVYTRPIDSSLAEKAFTGASGEKKPGTNPQTKTANKTKVDEAQQKEHTRKLAQFVDERVNELVTKHGRNRYQYGINSAGVYVYAHDKDKVVTQFALIPQKNITVSKDTQELSGKDSPLAGGTAMVRPVSDERGFEVIGHFRYGRGVALRDGSLVLNENVAGGKNSKTNVDLQFALSGDLFATLNAQSQGLTAIQSAYGNPADVIARLQPEDLQTAATLVPGGPDGQKKPQFSETGTNFIDVAPLNSPENKGLPPSVEAGQLSKALTLAEMSVREDTIPDDGDCECQMGRADLAFINVGYQVKVLNPANPDTAGLFDNSLVAFNTSMQNSDALRSRITTAKSAVAAIDDQIAELEKKLANASGFGGNESVAQVISKKIAALQQQKAEAQAVVSDLESQLAASEQQTSDLASDTSTSLGQPLPPGAKFANIKSRVEDYLFGLYQALDEPHQVLENALRGDPSGGDPDFRTLPDLFAGEDPSSKFAPPFGSMNRSGLGDPVATAQQASSAASDLKKKFSEFGDNLSKNVKKKTLAQEIANLKAKLDRLQKRLKDVQSQNQPGQSFFASGSGSTGVTQVGNTDTPESLQAEIAKTQQELAQKEAELAQLG